MYDYVVFGDVDLLFLTVHLDLILWRIAIYLNVQVSLNFFSISKFFAEKVTSLKKSKFLAEF